MCARKPHKRPVAAISSHHRSPGRGLRRARPPRPARASAHRERATKLVIEAFSVPLRIVSLSDGARRVWHPAARRARPPASLLAGAFDSAAAPAAARATRAALAACSGVGQIETPPVVPAADSPPTVLHTALLRAPRNCDLLGPLGGAVLVCVRNTVRGAVTASSQSGCSLARQEGLCTPQGLQVVTIGVNVCLGALGTTGCAQRCRRRR